MKINSLEDFYNDTAAFFPNDIHKEIGHFNVFKIEDVFSNAKKGIMAYNRRAYYKISFICGRNKAEYADKIIDIEKNALLFGTPKIPYHYVPQDDNQSGYFCIFTPDFLVQRKSGVVLDELPIFKPGGYPVFQLSENESLEIQAIFLKMQKEITSDYVFKYDLIRNYLLELIHYGQKLQPTASLYTSHTASERVSSLFIELLERQFPVEPSNQKLLLKSPKDFADRLAVHVNHLNKVLKETTGHTTSNLIGKRIAQEAKILLRQTDYNISEVAYCLGFEEVAHFSNFFKKHTSLAPINFKG